MMIDVRKTYFDLYIGLHYPAKDSLPIIVMEKMQFSLRGLVECCGSIRWEKKLSIMNDVGFGLQYLHNRSPPIIHRDLTPNNVLLCHHLRAKISDLGVAKILHNTNTKTLTQNPGMNNFMPPECLSSKPVYGLPLDIFSFGGVILYICTQQWPELSPLIGFDPDTGDRIISTELQRRQKYLDEMIGASKDLKPLVLSCLEDNPKSRPLVGEALRKIQHVIDAYNEKMYCKVLVADEQSTPQLLHNEEQKLEQQQTQVS